MSPRRASRSPDSAEPARIGLAGLDAGPLERAFRVETPGESLGALPLPFEYVDVEVEVRRADGAAVRARGTLGARATVECRRCLEPTRVGVRAKWAALYRPPGRVTPGEEGVWSLDAGSGELDLAGPIREELWVNAPAFVECSHDCAGLCPTCGVRLAEQACRCPPPEPDARWAALEGSGGGSARVSEGDIP
ncbi:YceD family protein [Candidatus Palauibacter sp.]|uniref:YceD family protein n=1 Tax=Candidatus Palauibacter sp. TaxID=3101350 RepID=UPI003B520327